MTKLIYVLFQMVYSKENVSASVVGLYSSLGIARANLKLAAARYKDSIKDTVDFNNPKKWKEEMSDDNFVGIDSTLVNGITIGIDAHKLQ